MRHRLRSRIGHPASDRPSVILYARVSSKDQEKEGFSIPAQLQLLRTYAATNRLNVLREFMDVETAKQAGRTGFGEMIATLCRQQLRPVVLVEKTNRLYRNLKDWVTIDELASRSTSSKKASCSRRSRAPPKNSYTGSRS